MDFKSKCPRCGAKAAKLGNPIIAVGKTRGLRINVFRCPECNLVFYEGFEE